MTTQTFTSKSEFTNFSGGKRLYISAGGNDNYYVNVTRKSLNNFLKCFKTVTITVITIEGQPHLIYIERVTGINN